MYSKLRNVTFETCLLTLKDEYKNRVRYGDEGAEDWYKEEVEKLTNYFDSLGENLLLDKRHGL